MSYLKGFVYWLMHREILWLLFVVNGLGTLYGFYWYKNQLLSTPWYWWPFVPDSPTASLLFTIVLVAFLLGKRWLYIEAFAAVTLYKYGLWACIMIIWTGYLGGDLDWQHYMLIISHFGMALQALLFSAHFRFGLKHLLVIALWTLTNDLLDYSIGIFPWLNSVLHPYLGYVSLITVFLSVSGLLIFYWTVARHRPVRT